jgi:hypothetical protein
VSFRCVLAAHPHHFFNSLSGCLEIAIGSPDISTANLFRHVNSFDGSAFLAVGRILALRSATLSSQHGFIAASLRKSYYPPQLP